MKKRLDRSGKTIFKAFCYVINIFLLQSRYGRLILSGPQLTLFPYYPHLHIQILHDPHVDGPGQPVLVIGGIQKSGFLPVGQKAAFHDNDRGLHMQKQIVIIIRLLPAWYSSPPAHSQTGLAGSPPVFFRFPTFYNKIPALLKLPPDDSCSGGC